jgi:opacity protein-like surface antigen
MIKNMRKTIYIIALCAVLPLGAAFGTDFSLGGGGFLGGLFTRYTLTADGKYEIPGLIETPVDVLSTQEINQINYGGYLFFDAAFAELSLGFHRGDNTWREDLSINSPTEGEVYSSNPQGTGTELMLDLTLLGKYPFRLGERFTLFPLAGVEYQIALLERRKQGDLRAYDRTDGVLEKDSNRDAYRLSAWNSLLIDIGAGFDFIVFPSMYLRAELLYGFRLMTPYEVDALEKVKKLANAPNPKLGGLTSGPVLRIGVGYRLW